MASAKKKSTPIHIVWFKRDLRVHDHKPLWHAAQQGAVLPLYIVEPKMLTAPDAAPSHWTFIKGCIEDLRESLAQLGQPLVVRIGSALSVFKSLNRQVNVAHIWAHEETGNWRTYQRDNAIRDWARAAHVPMTELPQNSVVRRLQSRDLWAGICHERMREALTPIPEALEGVGLQIGRIPDLKQLKLGRDRRTIQTGGESQAIALFDQFLTTGADQYLHGLFSPHHAPDLCSRLSPHLAHGTISVRRVIQSTKRRIYHAQRNKEEGFDKAAWVKNLKAFQSRVQWRDHFIQKLEDEPEIEFQNFVRELDGLREPQFSDDYFDRWCQGQTGYPLIDAAMRSLLATGWINFRMRAMLISFASYDLWLHWRKPALHLARCFVDYEPGIHYSQMQMQAGTTGINTIRVYNPTKQALEHDADGLFIRRWVPELADVPQSFLHEPWRMPPSVQQSAGCILGRDYPKRIVDHQQAASSARKRLYRARQRPAALESAQAVLQKHGSRRQNGNKGRSKGLISAYQMEFNLFDV